MKFRSVSIHRLHHRLFDCAAHKWKSKDTLGIYSLRWGLEHGLVIQASEGVVGMLTDISFLRAFHDKYPLHRLVTYWYMISPEEDGRVYQRAIEIRLKQPVNRSTAQEMNSIINLFHDAKWSQQGAVHIESIMQWVSPLEKKHPKIVSSLTMKKGQFLLASGNVMESVSGFVEATDVLKKRKSKSAGYVQHLFQKVQEAISRGSKMEKADFQEMWDDLQKMLPIHNRNRFSIELMVVEYMFSGIDAQIDYIEQLRDRLPLIDDPKAKAGYKEVLETNLDEKRFTLLFANKRYKEALNSANVLMGRIKSLSLSDQVQLLCTTGLCYVHLKQLNAAKVLYQQLKEVWLPRFQGDQHLFQKWHGFLEALGKANARHHQRKKNWKEALEWSCMEVDSTLWNLKYLQASAKEMGLPMNGNKQNIYAIAVYQRANLHKNMKEYALAKADYCTSIEMLEDLHTYGKSIHRKNLSLAWHMLGALCALEKNSMEALRAYEEALVIRSDLLEVRTDMQELWIKSATKVSSLRWKRYQASKEEHLDTLPSLLQLRKDLEDSQAFAAARTSASSGSKASSR